MAEQRLKDAAFPVRVDGGEWLVAICLLRMADDQRFERLSSVLTKIQLIGDVEVFQTGCNRMRQLGDVYGETPECVVTTFRFAFAEVVPDAA